MNPSLIASIPRGIVLNGLVRYGVARNVPAEDEEGRPVKLALVVVEHANGELGTLSIREDLIAFAGEGIIENEVKRFLAK